MTTEAEYAWHAGRDVIILNLTSEYEPEGWLLPLVEAHPMTFDLSTDEKLDTVLPNLIRQLGSRARSRQVHDLDGECACILCTCTCRYLSRWKKGNFSGSSDFLLVIFRRRAVISSFSHFQQFLCL